MAALGDYTTGFRQTELPATVVSARGVMLFGILPVWEVDTVYTEKRAYVFLTKAAAEACVAAMTTEFTVSRMTYIVSNNAVEYLPINVCVAKTTATKRADIDAYDVTVDVYDSVKTITAYTGVEE